MKVSNTFPVLITVKVIILSPSILFELANDPCNKVNFGGKFKRENSLGSIGTMNPCGNYDCKLNEDGTNSCLCPPPFIAVNNVDGSQTCVPSN